MTTFLLIRHGLTDAIGRTLTGTRAGVPLNDAGRSEVARLVERLHGLRVAAVVSSPLERALDTAAPIAADHGLAVEIVPALTEFEVGDWSGESFSALEQQDAWRRFNRIRSLADVPGGERMIDVQRRAIAALLEVARRYPDATVAVVSHGDVIRAALLYVLGMPIDFIHRIDIATASVSVVEIGDGLSPRVRLMNGDSVPDRP